MRLSELSGKDIVEVRRAERLGMLGNTDLEINENGKITALIIPSVKWFGIRRNGHEIRVPWEHVKKIGDDIVLIDIKGKETVYEGETKSR